MSFFRLLFSADRYMPHGHCYLWTPGLLWMHVVSDMLIGLSYVAISTMLTVFVIRGRKDIPLRAIFLAFGLFIVACGGTHFMEVWTTWVPLYWLSGLVKIVTALASVFTAIALPKVLPIALGLLRTARMSEQRREDLEQAHSELNTLYGQLQEFDNLKTQFFANVSHELRTPLALILGPTEKMLAAPARTPEERRDLEVVDRNARTLLKHVNDLLDVSKLEAGKMGVHYAHADLGRLVRLCAAHFDALATERGIDYIVETPDHMPAEVDAEKVQRVVLNLLSNAFKFTPNTGTIRCSARVLDDTESLRRTVQGDGAENGEAETPIARITVADSGPGVPADKRDHVFERFHQVDGGATRQYGGTGLGLAIAQDFARLHGGDIRVMDAPEGGALFALDIPLRAPEGADVQSGADAGPDGDGNELARQAMQELRVRVADAAPGVAAGRARVLVVEDNPEMNRFVAETLAAEYMVETAFDGQDGLEKALGHPPDLILSDIMMPRMSGDQLVLEARKRPELNGIPIVMLTAKADDDLRVSLLRDGAQDYLMKPFAAEELLARVGNQVTMKRAREVLQNELQSQNRDVEELANEVSARKREQQSTLDALSAALEEAERASQVKTNFLRMVSHELRNPLNALQLQMQLLQRITPADAPPKQQDIMRKMSGSSGRLLSLIESLLEHARLESGQVQLRVEAIDVPKMAAGVVEEWRIQADQKRLELTLEPPPPMPPLETDPRLASLILTNLVGNAIKFTETGGVWVSLGHEDGTHVIRVRDTGPGIPADRQSQVFQAFEHLEPVRNKHTPGVGLGLAIVKEMTEALGGRITLESADGKGSLFTVYLPPSAPTPTTETT